MEGNEGIQMEVGKGEIFFFEFNLLIRKINILIIKIIKKIIIINFVLF